MRRRHPLGADISVKVLQETEFNEWVDLVSESPDGSIFSLPSYLDVLCRSTGGRFSVIGVRYGDEMVGGVGLYEVDSPHGTRVSPRHLLSYNGIVLRRYGTRYPSQQNARHVKILSGLEDTLSKRGYSRVTMNCRSTLNDFRPFLAAGWSATPQYTYEVPIDDLDLLWSRVEQNLRRLIKRCGKDGMTVTDDHDIGACFRMHADTMKRKGRGPYLSEPAFRKYFETLRAADLCRLFHARLPDGRPIATQLVLLGPNPVTHTVVAAADPEFMKTGVAAFLRWKVFETVSAMGFAGNDLTGAGLGPVTHFKSQLGGDLRLFLVLNSPFDAKTRLGSRAEAMYRQGRMAVASVARYVGLKTS